jgi:hypothetical protein
MTISKTPTKPAEAEALPYGGDTCTVALKLPWGLKLQLFEMTEVQEITATGFKSVRMARKVGEPYELRGYGHIHHGEREKLPVVAGYALNHGVPRVLFETWLKLNEKSDLVRNKLIFGYPEVASVEAFCRDHDRVDNGLLPISQETPNDRLGGTKHKNLKLEKGTTRD